MGRQNRVEFPNTIYHIFSRGNNKAVIFADAQDYNVFLKHLKETKKENDFSFYAYCLMPNHFHLLIETLEAPVSKIMQKLLTCYAIYFNSKYKRTGHVFQDRYKAIVCDKEEYLFKLVRYIHLNPLRAKLIADLDRYKWSSHSALTGKITNDALSLKKLFNRMDCGSLTGGYRAYNNLIKEFHDAEKINDSGYFLQYLDLDKILGTGTNKILNIEKLSLDEILQEICEKANLSKELILSKNKSKKSYDARKLFSSVSINKYGYSPKEVSDYIGKDLSIVYRYLLGAKIDSSEV